MEKVNFNKRYKRAKAASLFWTLFIGAGAVLGAVGMFVDPTGKAAGMDGLLPGMQKLPFANVLFQNLIFPGIALLLVNGVPNFVAAAFLFKNKKAGAQLTAVFGFTLMLWITIQFVIYPLNVLSTLYFVFGIAELIAGYVCYVGYMQSTFVFDEKDYPSVGADGSKLVVYFSRLSYTKKLAYQIADEQKAEILQLKALEKTDGYLGFWWSGRFGMHRWGMPIENAGVDLKKYDEITICSPIWVFGLSAPVREFCKRQNGNVKTVNYVLTHFMNSKFSSAAREMDALLGVNHKSFRSFRCRFGRYKEIK